MKKIGFIDYYLDEWHANNYPEFIKNTSDDFCVSYAWGKIDSQKENGLTNKEWAQKYGIELCESVDEVIQKSDCLIVLSPDNPEMHEELCQKPLSSGKLVYVDKTFAPDAETAKRIFKISESGKTKTYSSSALRFASELQDFKDFPINRLYTRGPGVYEIYSIHQIEPIITLMNSQPKRVMFTGTKTNPSMIIEFSDGRYAQMYQAANADFEICAVDESNNSLIRTIKSDFFANFIKDLLDFFKNGEIKVPHAQTVSVIAVREAGFKAMNTPFAWVEV